MTDKEYYSQEWLRRMWNKEEEIKEYEKKAKDLLGAKVSDLDSDKIRGGADPNPTETKNLEYSTLMFEIDKKKNELSYENILTFNVIQNLKDAKFRGILFAYYVNRKTIKQIAVDFHYAESSVKEFKRKALNAIYPFIPKGEVIHA